MKLFLDTIDAEEIKKYNDFGLVDGITTNPSLMAKSKEGFYETTKKLASLIKGDVSIEAVSNDFNSMIEEGQKILAIAENIAIKLPITWDGLKACKYFSKKGYKTNMTLCFSTTQAILAAKCGATYVSPFIGRLDDIGEDGLQLIADIREIYDNYKFNTQILAASIRNIEHIAEASIIGADIVTISPKLMSELITHPLTDKGLEQFNQDWSKSGMKI